MSWATPYDKIDTHPTEVLIDNEETNECTICYLDHENGTLHCGDNSFSYSEVIIGGAAGGSVGSVVGGTLGGGAGALVGLAGGFIGGALTGLCQAFSTDFSWPLVFEVGGGIAGGITVLGLAGGAIICGAMGMSVGPAVYQDLKKKCCLANNRAEGDEDISAEEEFSLPQT